MNDTHTMYLELGFNGPVNEDERKRLTELIAEELEFGDLRNHHYRKQGWGIGTSLIIKVREYRPQRDQSGRERDLEIHLDAAVGVTWPDDPIRGRFNLWGRVKKGIRPAIGRRAIIKLTMDEANTLVNDLSAYMLKHRNCGITPKPEED